MKFLFLFSLFCVLVATGRAAVAYGFFKSQKHPGKCVFKNLVLSPGDEIQEPSDCGKLTCGVGGVITFYTCSIEGVPRGYKLGKPIYAGAQYPDCCKKKFIPIG